MLVDKSSDEECARRWISDMNLCLSGPAIQSVMSSGDALTPGKTGGVGSAVFNLHDNGTLDYQVRICDNGLWAVAWLSLVLLGGKVFLIPIQLNNIEVLV